MFEKIFMFKVVRGAPDNYVSARVEDTKYRIQYPFNKWVTPKLNNSRIFVYGNYYDALNFSTHLEHIFLCEVKDIVRIYTASNYHYDIENFWSSNTFEYPQTTFDIPVYGCKKIKLVKKLKQGEF